MKGGQAALGLMVVVSLTLLGCVSVQPEAQDSPGSEDQVLAARVKGDLIRATGIAAAAIDVDSRDGVVRLSGFVENHTQRAQAESLAREVKGVLEVDNRIVVKGTREEGVPPQDE